MKKKLEANNSLPAFTDGAGDDAKTSTAAMQTFDYGMVADTPQNVASHLCVGNRREQRRPVTGRVRLTRNNEQIMYSNLQS